MVSTSYYLIMGDAMSGPREGVSMVYESKRARWYIEASKEYRGNRSVAAYKTKASRAERRQNNRALKLMVIA